MFKIHIIRQPDGKIAIWDSDNCYFICMGLSEEELEDSLIKVNVEKLRNIAKREIRLFKENEEKKYPPNYYMTFKRALDYIETVHGSKAREEVWNNIGKLKIENKKLSKE